MTLPRRQFLAHSAAGLAALSALPCSGAAAADSSASRLKLGLVTYNWGKNWDLPTVIANCEATGFKGVELRSTHKHGVEIDLDAAQRAAVRQRFADSDVELVGLGSACEYHAVDPAVLQKNIEETKQFVKLCRDVGGSGVKVRPNGLPAERPVEATIEQIGKSLNQVGRFGAEHGVQIRVEVHGRGTSEIHHMKSIMDVADHPNVVVCWNCNPADLHGDGLQANYRSLQDRMGTIHIHDLRGDQYPWEALFELLKQTDAPGFTGWTLLEDGRVPEDIVAAMKANTEVWNTLAGRG
ncbi:sugar phosphate isomerase/epimerase family protein [Roseimaritima sediminicola]|uniref:sugar phosphate isomerase/epimerase family protein n=1 Tax=Roseimaritima sediminicola TaxID=2662066 RepID=UPI0012983D13|nr:sugar phosphate isomerase/epimerase family protein [Roseimaritima sediminicola]